jgi:6-phosphogluconolactonase
MAKINVYPSNQELAEAAAKNTVDTLKAAVDNKGHAIWVLSGGTAPQAAYGVIADKYSDYVDWQNVYLLIGDERTVEIDSEDSNWEQIKTNIDKLNFKKENISLPPYTKDNVSDAKSYSDKIEELFSSLNSNEIDLLWLGMGEDGHTLSLFPGQSVIDDTSGALVLDVDNSPKAPPKRITLSLKAIENVAECFCLTSGASKKDVFIKVKAENIDLPIVRVTQFLEKHATSVQWFIDENVIS